MNRQPRTRYSWIFVASLLVLAGLLGFLQYRWIGEVSRAERDRLRESLRTSLEDLSRSFDAEIASAVRGVTPADSSSGMAAMETEVTARYRQWSAETRHTRLFSRVAIAAPKNDAFALRLFDPAAAAFRDSDWPSNWPVPWVERDGPPGAGFGPPPRPPEFSEGGLVIEVPLSPPIRPDSPPRRFDRRAFALMIFELNPEYLQTVLLPQLVQRYLGSSYQVEVLSSQTSSPVVYRSDANLDRRIESAADADIGLFQLGSMMMRERGNPGGGSRGRGPGMPPDGSRFAPSRWHMYVRHRAGSLEVVVEQARRRNLAVTAGVLLLMLAAVAALVRYTRRAQRLAGLEMDFVAGVSHELRTPLAVIHTAAYNLRGKVAHNPAQVEQYGVLIQKETSRLKELVEQVLQFAAAKAGAVVRAPEALSIETVIEEAIEATRPLLEQTRSNLEKSVERPLPLIAGDRVALRHALENLLSNAAKYGSKDHPWIGVFARHAGDNGSSAIEICVADHGPGIPPDEQEHIFDAFYRGRKAVEDQVHGTGLGLNLARRIVEAHGGTIGVKSEPGKGTEMIVRLPAAPAEGPS